MKLCFDYALHYINRYPKTESELKLQLRKKGYAEDEIDEAVDKLKELNYVNDEEFINMYLNSQVVRKGKPVLRIKHKLLSKGVDEDLVDEYIHKLEEELHEGMEAKINDLIEKYKKKGDDGIAIIRKLQSRGYFMDDIKKVINQRDTSDS